MRKGRIILSLLLSTVFMFSACFKDDDKGSSKKSDSKREKIVAKSIIDIPGCVSESRTTKVKNGKPVSKSGSNQDTLEDVYEGIRETVGGIEDIVDVVEEIVVGSIHIFSHDDSGDWTRNDNDPDKQKDPTRVKWQPDTVHGYKYKVELFWGENGDQKGLEVYLTIDEDNETAKGIITWDMGNIPHENNDTKLQVTFDGSVEPKILTVKAIDITQEKTEDATSAWLQVTENSSHIINISGNYYCPTATMFEAETTEERNYVFAITGYNEDYLDENKKNKAILNLAIPETSIDSNLSDWQQTMWNDYSVGEVFKQAVYEFIMDKWATDGVTAADIQAWSDVVITDIAGVTVVADLQPDHILTILEGAFSKDPTNTDLSGVFFLIDLVNSAYFRADGFWGTYNDDSGKGTLSVKPADFSDLDINSVNVVAPIDVKNLTIDFL